MHTGLNRSGYVVFGHGSSVESANDAVRAMAAELRRRCGDAEVETAFLESGRPDLRGAIDLLAGKGVGRMIVIPYFLTLGLHLQRDLPRLVEEIRASHPGLQIQVTPPLDGHPALIDALLGRAREATEGKPGASETD
ncbi:MAG: CbiX/SirB N-terminal domain-containing protein [Acidobacteriota bacterium]